LLNLTNILADSAARCPYHSPMRVLIVGCGYVGLPLGVELIRLGHEVFGLRRSASAESELKTAGIQPLFGDVTRPETLAKLPREFDWVVNCVAAGGGADDYRQVYLQGTRNLIEWLAPASAEASARQALKKFVYTSSTSVYGQTDGSQVKESSPTEPLAETAKILVETEKLLLAAVAERKFPAVILRVAGIYGPDRGHWFKQFLKDEARMEGDGSRFLNMIHRDDLIGCIIAALKNGRAGEIYNAADDEPVSQLHFFQWLAQSLDKPLPPSEPAAVALARSGAPRENPDAARKSGVTNKRVLNRKLKMELGYQFKHPNFRKGYSAELLRLDRAG
jgi:nucleoside-diphosphate-sugar epimerase